MTSGIGGSYIRQFTFWRRQNWVNRFSSFCVVSLVLTPILPARSGQRLEFRFQLKLRKAYIFCPLESNWSYRRTRQCFSNTKAAAPKQSTLPTRVWIPWNWFIMHISPKHSIILTFRIIKWEIMIFLWKFDTLFYDAGYDLQTIIQWYKSRESKFASQL